MRWATELSVPGAWLGGEAGGKEEGRKQVLWRGGADSEDPGTWGWDEG